MMLFRLGGAIARRRGVVLAVWFLLLVLAAGGATMLGDKYDDSVAIPGTESQQGQDVLSARFGLTGANGQVLLTATSGKITDETSSADVAQIIKTTNAVHGVSVSNPLTADDPVLSNDDTSTIAQLRFTDKVPSQATLDAVQEAATPPRSSTITTSVGGDAYKATAEPSHVPELLGLLVSFVILAITFGALLPAGMPIVSSLIGVGVTLSSVVLVSSLATVSSNAPTLAEMLGLAVGIDYALFILSRHRRHLGEGLSPAESMSRALATAGSAVVFAGATVVIALAGLSVAKIPVLTVMGLAAAAAVTIAVIIALTLVPAVALLFGERLRPRAARPPKKEKRKRKPRPPKPARAGFGAFWVRTVTRLPVLTIVAVLGLLALAAVPAASMRLSLPDNSTAPTSSTQRQTYDKITLAFGEGYNAPLSIAADVIASTDPKGTVSKLSDAVKTVPDVVAVTQATPNSGADTALIQAIPSAGQTAASTSDLVRELRKRAPGWEKEYGVSHILVTGQTAINIDVSERLGGALLPFACIVIGLSLVLLMIVFRSIAVPIKATLGYLLSVGVALGAVVAVFQWGWLSSVMGENPGPIVSFLPIFVMGVLFGLAMDYEMFLVSAMREEYVQSGDAVQAVHRGFRASAKVVTAAALIMSSVFVAFIPGGSATIKPIALGLAVGVFVDAFVVRMTLVPAVLVLLGRRAWWLPGWLDRLLPEVDVEGAALHRKVEFESWESEHGVAAVLATDLVVHAGDHPVDVVGRPSRVTRVRGDRALGSVLAGRSRPASGRLLVAGLLLPEQREAVNQVATMVDLAAPPPVDAERLVAARARLVSFSPRQRQAYAVRAAGLVAELSGTTGESLRGAVLEAALAVSSCAEVIVLVGLDELDADHRTAASALAEELAGRGLAVLLVDGAAAPAYEKAGPELVESGAGATHE
ncbi:MMPL family transporter [Marmoricola sp. URHB0036]|uniref:MMPL family transporter n=1 Tax=Marmoricola sp. URHB0036 TaxID=1298863 RepID=UPI000406C7D5|nr:MMPL family transporter [Marmoricola sp. URHB0036]